MRHWAARNRRHHGTASSATAIARLHAFPSVRGARIVWLGGGRTICIAGVQQGSGQGRTEHLWTTGSCLHEVRRSGGRCPDIVGMRVDGCGAVTARSVRGKSRADLYVVGWLDQLHLTGTGRRVRQADGEPSRGGFSNVVEEAARSTCLGIAAARTPSHDQQRNGCVVRAGGDVRDHVKVMRLPYCDAWARQRCTAPCPSG